MAEVEVALGVVVEGVLVVEDTQVLVDLRSPLVVDTVVDIEVPAAVVIHPISLTARWLR